MSTKPLLTPARVPVLSSQQTAELVESVREATRHLERARARLQAKWCYSCEHYQAGPGDAARCGYWVADIPLKAREQGCDAYEPDIPF